jgi:hypothetical protein
MVRVRNLAGERYDQGFVLPIGFVRIRDRGQADE